MEQELDGNLEEFNMMGNVIGSTKKWSLLLSIIDFTFRWSSAYFLIKCSLSLQLFSNFDMNHDFSHDKMVCEHPTLGCSSLFLSFTS